MVQDKLNVLLTALEREENASLEEVVMTVKTRQDLFPCETQVDTNHIVPASKLVSSITGFQFSQTKYWSKCFCS